MSYNSIRLSSNFVVIVLLTSSFICISSHSSNPSLFVHCLKVSDTSGPLFSNFYLYESDTFHPRYGSSVEIDVIDEDGVDTVWVQYRWEGRLFWSFDVMENHPPFHNDTYDGYIKGTLEPGDNRIFIKFVANDTLGNISESQLQNRSVYYMREEGPPSFLYYLLPWLAGPLGVVVLIGIGVWRYRKR